MADLRHLGLEPVNGQHPGESKYRLRRDQPEEGLSHFNSALKAVHRCSPLLTAVPRSHSRRCIRANPLNPSNPRPKMLMPTSRATN
jgi:hypothetical protein